MAHLVVSVLQHVQFWTNSFHIWHKWSLEGVSHAMTSDLDIYLQGYLSVTSPVSWILFMCHKYNPWGDDDDLLYHFQVNRSKVGVINSFEFLQLITDLQFLVYFDLLIPLAFSLVQFSLGCRPNPQDKISTIWSHLVCWCPHWRKSSLMKICWDTPWNDVLWLIGRYGSLKALNIKCLSGLLVYAVGCVFNINSIVSVIDLAIQWRPFIARFIIVNIL